MKQFYAQNIVVILFVKESEFVTESSIFLNNHTLKRMPYVWYPLIRMDEKCVYLEKISQIIINLHYTSKWQQNYIQKDNI